MKSDICLNQHLVFRKNQTSYPVMPHKIFKKSECMDYLFTVWSLNHMSTCPEQQSLVAVWWCHWSGVEWGLHKTETHQTFSVFKICHDYDVTVNESVAAQSTPESVKVGVCKGSFFRTCSSWYEVRNADLAFVYYLYLCPVSEHTLSSLDGFWVKALSTNASHKQSSFRC